MSGYVYVCKILDIFIIEIYSSYYYLWFSSSTPVSSTNKTDRHDITEILLKVALNAISLLLLNQMFSYLRHMRPLSILAIFVMAIDFFLLLMAYNHLPVHSSDLECT